jgi:hypothetical protein
VLYGGEARGNERDVWIRAFRRGGAYCLVGAAGAVVCFACLERLGARAVLYLALLACFAAAHTLSRYDESAGGGVHTRLRCNKLRRILERRVEINLCGFFE